MTISPKRSQFIIIGPNKMPGWIGNVELMKRSKHIPLPIDSNKIRVFQSYRRLNVLNVWQEIVWNSVKLSNRPPTSLAPNAAMFQQGRFFPLSVRLLLGLQRCAGVCGRRLFRIDQCHLWKHAAAPPALKWGIPGLMRSKIRLKSYLPSVWSFYPSERI